MSRHSAGLLVASLALQLLATGCLGGGGSGGGDGSGGFLSQFFSFFGGGSDATELIEFLAPAGSAGSSGEDAGGGGAGGPANLVPDVATAHYPEPASLALFGSGLAGLTLLRRRKTFRRSFR